MGTSSGGMRLPIVVHHEGEDIPLDNPAPARPTSSVAGVNIFADDITTRNAIEPTRRIFDISKMARRSRESAAAPENRTAKIPASGAIAEARVTSTGSLVRRSMMKPLTKVTIQTPTLENRPVPWSQRKARLRSGASSSLTGLHNSNRTGLVNSRPP